MRTGNPAPVVTSEAEYGDTCWAAEGGRAVAVGTYRGGIFHPSRVFNT
jgi:tRNA pseudouridine55 synthase